LTRNGAAPPAGASPRPGWYSEQTREIPATQGPNGHFPATSYRLSYEDQREARRQRLIAERMRTEGGGQSQQNQPQQQPPGQPRRIGPPGDQPTAPQPNGPPAVVQPPTPQAIQEGIRQFAAIVGQNPDRAIDPLRAVVANRNATPAQLVDAVGVLPPEVRRTLRVPPVVAEAISREVVRRQDERREDPNVVREGQDITPAQAMRLRGTASQALMAVRRNDPAYEPLLRLTMLLSQPGPLGNILGRSAPTPESLRQIQTELRRLPPEIAAQLLGQ
jgi:hypothetical protein